VQYVERLAARTSSEGLPISPPSVKRAMPDELEKNLLAATCIQADEEDEAKRTMTTWHKRDWQQFYELARRPWQRHRPPRPVYPTGLNRVLPAQGFSLSELDDAGVDLDLAERLGLPVDAGRIGAYGPNVTVLRDFVRSSRQPR
jgi:ribosomal protein L13E